MFGGGVIPQEDVAVLLQAGIERLFPPGTDTGEIVRFLRERLGVGEDQGASASSSAAASSSPSRR